MTDKYYLAVPRKKGHRTSGMWASMVDDDEEEKESEEEEEESPPNILIVDLEDLEDYEQAAVKAAFEDTDVGLVSMGIDKERYDSMMKRVSH